MPQLNPNPWFDIMVFSWIVFATIIPAKILNYVIPNETAPMDKEKQGTKSWTWPW